MKETKRRLMTFTFYDRSGIERDLEEQAAQGWLLEKTSAFGWIYRRTEPAKIRFSVVYFPAASAFDPGPSENQLRFREFCAHTGWELVASNGQLQIFCNRRENPVPIETDPTLELENIHASVKKSVLPTYGMNLVLGFLQIGLAVMRFSMDPIGELASLGALLSMLFWVLMLFSNGTQMILYYRWLRKARAAAREGNFLETRSTDRFQIVMILSTTLALTFMLLSFGGGSMLLLCLALVVGILGITAAVIWLSNRLKRSSVKAGTNRLVTYGAAVLASMALGGLILWGMVSVRLESTDRRSEALAYEYNNWTFYVYRDTIPLRIEDLMETDYTGYSREMISDISSPLLSRLEARQRPRHDALKEPELLYRVIHVKAPFLYRWVLDLMKEEFSHGYGYPENTDGWEEHRPIDPSSWGAKEAWQLVLGGEAENRYLLCYEGYIVEIDLDWEPTQAQKAVIAQKLLP